MTHLRFQIFSYRQLRYVNYTSVGWDDYKIGKRRELLGTDSVASCLAITLYDPEIRVGALAHIIGRYDSPEELKPEKIIDTLLYKLYPKGNIEHQRLEASLVGEGKEKFFYCKRKFNEI